MSFEKSCFVIAPIGSEDSKERHRSDQILKYIIMPIVSELGYKLIRADKIAESGSITNQIITNIVESELVIADLTGHNPNVFYELAVRHTLKKPYIQMIEAGEKIPFDVAGNRTIFLDIKDLDKVENSKLELKKQIETIESNTEIDVDNPISMAINLNSLKESKEPLEAQLANIIEGISDIKRYITQSDKQQTVNIPDDLLFDFILQLDSLTTDFDKLLENHKDCSKFEDIYNLRRSFVYITRNFIKYFRKVSSKQFSLF